MVLSPEVTAIRLPPEWAWVMYCDEPAVVRTKDLEYCSRGSVSAVVAGWVTVGYNGDSVVYMRGMFKVRIDGNPSEVELCQALANMLWMHV